MTAVSLGVPSVPVVRRKSRQVMVGPLPAIAARSPLPMIADIHFQPRYVYAAIDAGCAGVRVSPGNIRGFDDQVAGIARAASAAGVPIRNGVNAGSLDQRLLAKHGKATPAALVESALWGCSLFEEHGYRDLKISVTHHDPLVMMAAYRELARRCDYPLHLGVTEAGPLLQGTIKSAVAFGVLLAEGIGDTMRVSLSAPVVEEVEVGAGILESLGLRPRQLVNDPGEAREADLGVSSGNGKGQIFVRGEVVRTVPEHRIVEALLEEALQREWGERS